MFCLHIPQSQNGNCFWVMWRYPKIFFQKKEIIGAKYQSPALLWSYYLAYLLPILTSKSGYAELSCKHHHSSNCSINAILESSFRWSLTKPGSMLRAFGPPRDVLLCALFCAGRYALIFAQKSAQSKPPLLAALGNQ